MVVEVVAVLLAVAAPPVAGVLGLPRGTRRSEHRPGPARRSRTPLPAGASRAFLLILTWASVVLLGACGFGIVPHLTALTSAGRDGLVLGLLLIWTVGGVLGVVLTRRGLDRFGPLFVAGVPFIVIALGFLVLHETEALPARMAVAAVWGAACWAGIPILQRMSEAPMWVVSLVVLLAAGIGAFASVPLMHAAGHVPRDLFAFALVPGIFGGALMTFVSRFRLWLARR